MKVGIIDMGSNSIRLMIADVDGTQYTVTDQIKHSARLGQDMTENNELAEDRIDYAIKVLSQFRDFMKLKGVEEVLAFATEAVRKAKNQESFLKRARKVLGTDIRVLSGLEEAFYDYYGCVNTIDVRNALIFDIGGSSTELIHLHNRYLKDSISIHVGSIPLTEMFELNRNLTEEKIRILKNFIMNTLKSIPWLKNASGLNLIGVGGSVRTLGKIDRIRKGNLNFIAHNYSMDTKDADEAEGLVRNYLMTGKNKVRGLPKDREDIFIGSAIFIECLAQYLKSQKIFISGSGVRDGILFEYILGSKKIIPDVLEYSLKNIIRQHMGEGDDGEKVYALSEKLFEVLSLHDESIAGRHKELKTAAYLHDIGRSINFYQRDRNTFYSILNAPLNGLSQKQILMAASIATLYNSDDLLKENFNRKLLDKKDIQIIEKLGLIIKIVEGILYGTVEDVRIKKAAVEGNEFIITLKTDKDLTFTDEQIRYYLPLFKRAFRLNLKLRKSEKQLS